MKLEAIIRGARFHPPAPLVISLLPLGTELLLEPEPDNPYDRFAVKVRVRTALAAPFAAQIDPGLPNFGVNPETFWASASVWLGYVAKENAEAFQAALSGANDWRAELALHPTGQPLVILEVP